MRDERNEKYNATHYTIAPKEDMPLASFKHLLEQFARVLLKEVV